MSPRDRVERLLAEAIDANTAGRHPTADRLLRQALVVIATWPAEDRDPMRARLLVTAALPALELKGRVEALDTLVEARRLAVASHRPDLLGLSHIQEGNVHARCADWKAAVDASGQALRYADRLSPQGRYAAHLNRGLAYLSLLRFGAARADLEEALRLAGAEGRVDREFKALHNLGCLAYAEGDLPRALQLMDHADSLPADVSRARARLDHAQVFIEAGLVDRARALLEEVFVAARAERLQIEAGEISLGLGRCALLDGDLRAARRHTGDAIRAYQSRATEERRATAELLRAQIDVTMERIRPEVDRATGRWLDHPDPSRPETRWAAAVAAEAALVVGDLATADRLAAQLRLGRPTSLSADLHEHLVRARLALAHDDLRAARATLRRSSVALARRQGVIQDLDLRAGMAMHGGRLRDLDLHLARATGSPLALLDAVERWRATSHRLSRVVPPPDPATAALVAQVRRLRSPVLAGPGPGSQDLEAVRLERDVARRMRKLPSADDPDLVRPRSARILSGLAKERGGVVVSFAVVDGRLLRICLGRPRASVADLGQVRLIREAAVRLVRDARAEPLVAPGSPVAPVLRRAMDASAARLDDVLFGSDAEVGPGRVVISPPRELTSVPWNMLPSLIGRPVTVVPSLSRWAAFSTAAPVGQPTVAVLAGPGLARAADEVGELRRIWRSAGAARQTSGSGDEARTDTVLNALAGGDVVHLAAHGLHDESSPLFSSLLLHDGPLVAHQLRGPLRAAHVVLAACDVGQARVRPGDEPLGLTAALLALGVRSVVASVAPVRDDDARAAMTRYHGALARGADAASALAAALVEVPGARSLTLFGADWSATPSPHR